MPLATCPGFSLGPLPVSPDNNAGPYTYGYGMAPAAFDFTAPVRPDLIHPSHVPPADEATIDDSPDLLAQRPAILDVDDRCFPEFSHSSAQYIVRSLSRSALRMLWHQRLGHINFRRLSEMHRFVKGMP